MTGDYDPAVVVPRYEREIIMASWLYYSTSGGFQSPLTDAEYDQRVTYVIRNWSETSQAFRKRTSKDELAASGFHLKATRRERQDALRWAAGTKSL